MLRTPNGCSLTKIGISFLEDTKDIIHQFNIALTHTKNLSLEHKNELYIAIPIGTYLGMKYAAKAMIETDSRGAAIINIGSAAAQISSGGYSLYDSTKAAVLRLTKTGALDYAEHDITVNSVSPGVIETEIYSKLSPVQLQRSLSKCPTGHMGKPSDIANMCLFLATDMARYVTGAVINVDGGQTIGPYMPCTWEKPDTRKF